MTDTTDLCLWADSTYNTTLPSRFHIRFTGKPEIVTTPRKPWHENLEAKVRYEVSRLTCGQTVKINGVRVQRSHSPTIQSYQVASERNADYKPVYRGFEDATETIIRLVNRGDEHGTHESRRLETDRETTG